MTFTKYRFIIIAFLLLVISLIVHFTCGFYYDNSSNVNLNYLLNGSFVSAPLYLINTVGVYIYVSCIIQWLYIHLPHHHWFDIYMLTMNLCGFFLLLVIAARTFSNDAVNAGKPAFLKWILSVVLIGLWVDAYILVDLTKISFLLSFASLYLLSRPSAKRNRLIEPACYSIFFIALLNRPEPVVVVWVLHLVYLITMTDARQLRLFFTARREVAVTLVCIVIVSVMVNTPRTKTDSFYLSLRPYQYALWDFKYDRTKLVLKNKEDSAILRAAGLYFLADREKINAAYFERIGLDGRDKTPAQFWNNFTANSFIAEKWRSYLGNYLTKYWQLTAILILCSLLLLLSPGRKYGAVAFSLFTIGLLAVIAVFLKMEYHIYTPVLIISLTYLLLDLAGSDWPRSRMLMLCCLVFFMACTLLFDREVYDRYDGMRSLQSHIEKIRKRIDRSFRDRILVYNLSTYDKLKNRLFAEEELSGNNINISIDNGWMYLYPEYDQYMKKITGRSDFRGVMDYLIRRRRDVVFISAPLRMEVLSDYLRDVYGEDLNYSLAADDTAKTDKEDFWIRFYTLR